MNRIVLLIAIASTIASALLCWSVLGLIPHIPDELAYLYQGRILSAGRLWVEPPSVPEAFTVRWDHILRESGRWRTLYPPGWPLLLAPGWWIGAPWLINPLLLGISIIGLFKVTKQFFDDRTALLAVIAFATSPFVLLMGAGFMAHQSGLCFAIWCVFFLFRGRRNDYLIAGILGAFAFTIRPYTAPPLLLPLLLWAFWNAEQKKKMLGQVFAGSIPLLVLFCIYNYLLYGGFFRTGYSYDADAQFRGSLFHYFRSNVPWYFSNLNHTLWGWPWPDLLIFVPILFPHKKWKLDFLLFLCFLGLLFAYSFYYYRDIVYAGPRYIYEAVGFLAILAARSIQILGSWIERFTGRKTALLLALLFLYPLVSTLPQQMDYHRQVYHGQSRELLDLVKARGVGTNALILIGGDPHVFRTFFLENSLNPAKSERVFARDAAGLRETIMKAYDRKEIWLILIELAPLKGPNQYDDRALIQSVRWERIK
ncbi:glycosyltransferase family 39 protein [bacterium]|nr:glycosyltransferase family 39 protein [bacterium]